MMNTKKYGWHKVAGMALVCLALAVPSAAIAREVPRVFINPGHGGHDSDDRNNVVLNYAPGDTAGYWESNSNLSKGNSLVSILRKKGYEVATSRVQNYTNDDLDLFEIVALAANSGADLFLAIHSNATGTKNRVNFPLALYRGWTDKPAAEGSLDFAKAIEKHLYGNKTTEWSHKANMSGDWSFYTNWGYKVGLGVLRFNKLPGMLSEGSFHDYLPETLRLLNNNFCWLEAWNLSLGIDDYFGRAGKYGMGAVAGNVRYADRERADQSIKLFGNDKRMPVNNATVELCSKDGKVMETTKTDDKENGIFVFKNLKPGTYLLKVSAGDGSAAKSAEVTIKANQSSYCNFDL